MTPPVAIGATAARTLPRGLAAIVEALELDQAHLVTSTTLEEIRQRAGVATPSKVLAARLRERGWLLATAQRGVYEFAPGAHAGGLSRGDLTLPLQAVLRARPGLAVGLALQSAAWALGAADRAPARLEIAASDAIVARSLSKSLAGLARVVVFAPHLPWEHHRGVPVMCADSVLVHMAAQPVIVRSWSSAVEWLPDLAADASGGGLLAELAGRPHSVGARLEYLLSGLRPDLATVLGLPTRGKVYFGPRGQLVRHDSQRQIADTLLPFDPRTLEQVPL
ncbi:MAG TPA: type IV toxin-antitoxin system AbiEi family antitoxin [Actinopolymorphaceae bacterium]|jgi:hypothetical protein